MVDAGYQRLHTLLVPTTQYSLMIPSAMTAEVVNVPSITKLPFAQPWLIGVFAWRNRAVSAVSWEMLAGAREQPPVVNRSKLIIFHPLHGRNKWEFFAFLASADPQPHMVDNSGSLITSPPEPGSSPLIAAKGMVGRSEIVIPNMAELARMLYPLG